MNKVAIELTIKTKEDIDKIEFDLNKRNLTFMTKDKDIVGPFATMFISYIIFVNKKQEEKQIRNLLSFFEYFSLLKPRIIPLGDHYED